jgi:hypothetical protein
VFLPTINKLLYINEDKDNIRMLMQADLTNFIDGIMPKSVKVKFFELKIKLKVFFGGVK